MEPNTHFVNDSLTQQVRTPSHTHFHPTAMRTLVKSCAAMLAVLLLSPTLSALPTGIIAGSKNIGAVWFIGDSITQSNADGDANGSPRKSLYDLLVANGYTFTFTGHYTANIDGLPNTGDTVDTNLYQYHSGISGSVIGNNVSGRTGMTQNTPSFWTSGRLASVKPNVILIMLGTNDVDQNIDLANAPARLTTLLDTIYAQTGVGTPTVFVASIPPNRTSTPADPLNTATFNAAVPAVVSAHRNLGRDLRFVDQFTPLDTAYATNMMSDNLHTNSTGNATLALQWFNAIAAVVTPPVPAIVIEQPAGSPLSSGSSTIGFGTSLIGTGKPLTFKVKNTGTASLSGIAVTRDGANLVDFAVTTAPLTSVPAGGSTTFTVTFTPTASGTRLATLHIASNDTTKNPFNINLTGSGNTAPTFAGYQVATSYQTPTQVAVAKLSAKATDAEGDSLAVSIPGPATANGGTVVMQSASILYTPPTGFAGADTFAVTLTDARGAATGGTVTVTVGPAPAAGGANTTNPPKLNVLSNGNIELRFQGIPGQVYRVQRSTDLVLWSTLFTGPANAIGTLTFTDVSPPSPNGYYRLAPP